MCAVNREYLEASPFDPSHPARHFDCIAIPRFSDWISKDGQSCLAFTEVVQRAERNPTSRRAFRKGRQDVAQNWNTDEGGSNAVQSSSDFEEEIAAG
jgi:hypothetical protein